MISKSSNIISQISNQLDNLQNNINNINNTRNNSFCRCFTSKKNLEERLEIQQLVIKVLYQALLKGVPVIDLEPLEYEYGLFTQEEIDMVDAYIFSYI